MITSITIRLYRPVARIFFLGGGGGCVVWRGGGIFARIFFGGVRSLVRKGYFCQRFSVAVKSIYI